MRNPYEVLGVAKNAEPEEIRTAYKRLALRFHPDRNRNEETAEAQFREVATAYELLSNPEARAKFDRAGAPIRSVQELFARGAGRRVMLQYLPRAPMEPPVAEDVFVLVDEPIDGSSVAEVILPGRDEKVSIEISAERVWGEASGLGKSGGNLILKVNRRRRTA